MNSVQDTNTFKKVQYPTEPSGIILKYRPNKIKL